MTKYILIFLGILSVSWIAYAQVIPTSEQELAESEAMVLGNLSFDPKMEISTTTEKNKIKYSQTEKIINMKLDYLIKEIKKCEK